MFGGWKKLSFRANDIWIDRARSFCEKHVAQKFNDEYNCSPLEVFSQVVNGQNFKVIIIGKHFKKDEFKCFTAVTWVPAGAKPQPEFKENTFAAVDGKDCTLSADKKEKSSQGLLQG